MPSENVELVSQVFGGRLIPGADAEIELGELFADVGLLERHEELFDPEAPIEFETPYGGLLGGMSGPFIGAPGFHQGWQEWLGPWESFSLREVEVTEAGGKVLVLVLCAGRLSSSGLEVDTPAAALYSIDSGKIVGVRHFLDQDQARAEAGVSA